MTTASATGITCAYCGNQIAKGRFCSPECSQLWWIEQHDADRDEKPEQLLEPVVRLVSNRWQVVGMHTKNLDNNA